MGLAGASPALGQEDPQGWCAQADAVAAPAGNPVWIAPTEGGTYADVGSDHGLVVRCNPAAGWTAASARFECQELAYAGGHDASPWYPCRPGPAVIDPSDATHNFVHAHQGWVPTECWLDEGHPEREFGHNGLWRLRVTVTYMGGGGAGAMVEEVTTEVSYDAATAVWAKKPPPGPGANGEVTVEIGVTVQIPYIDAATLAGNPAGIDPSIPLIGLDRASTIAGFVQPQIAWAKVNVPPGQEGSSIRIHIRALNSTADLFVAEVAASPDTSGTWTWETTQAPGAAPGLYTYWVEWAGRNVWEHTHSVYLSPSTCWTEVGEYVGGAAPHIPLTYHTQLADGDDVAPTSAHAYVINGSPSNPDRFSVAAEGALAATLAEQAVTLNLPPLEGSPYYIVTTAVDGHGGLRAHGDVAHRNLPVLPAGARIETRVSEVYPNSDGRIFMSDHIGANPPAYVSDPTYTHGVGFGSSPALWGEYPSGTGAYWDGKERQCQPCVTTATAGFGEDTQNKARIEAAVEYRTVCYNAASTDWAPCVWAKVYFWLQDPDSNTLWDANGDTDDPATPNLDEAGHDNVRGLSDAAVTPVSANGLPVSMTYDGDTQAIVAAVLEFPDQGGDNYRVVASTTRKPDNVDDPRLFENGLPAGFVDVNTYLPPNAHRSGVLEVWRQMYYERDSMYRRAEATKESSSPGQSTVTVARTAHWQNDRDDPSDDEEDPSRWAVGQHVIIYGPSWHDWLAPEGSQTAPLRFTIQNVQPLTDGDGDVLTLNAPLPRFVGASGAYVAVVGDPGQGGITLDPAVHGHNVVDPGLMDAALGSGEGFVSVCQYPGLPRGIMASYVYAVPSSRHRAYFEHKLEPNVVHVTDAWRYDVERDQNVLGLTLMPDRDAVWLFGLLTSREEDEGPIVAVLSSDVERREAMAHEFGHVLGLYDYEEDPNGNPTQRCHPLHRDHTGDRACLMLYGTGDDAYEHDFGDGVVRLGGLAGSQGEPVDLLAITGLPDPTIHETPQ